MVAKRILTLVSTFAFLTAAAPALAHALLKKATPGVGSTVAAAPSEITINFSEGVEPSFSGLTLTAESGGAVPVGKSHVDPNDNATLVTPLSQPLKPGVYTVTWHAVAIDTHKTQGSFQFTVK
jgi:copper resistance protein C